MQLGGSGPGPEGGSLQWGRLAWGMAAGQEPDVRTNSGEMLIRGYCAAVSKIFKTKEDASITCFKVSVRQQALPTARWESHCPV